MQNEVESSRSIGLAEFIGALRQEIAQAIRVGKEADIKFKPGPIDLEVQVRAEHKQGLNGKIEFKILGTGASVGGDVGSTSISHQTLKMRLEIAEDGDKDTLINDRLNAPPR